MDRRSRLKLAAGAMGLLMMSTGCDHILQKRHEVPASPPVTHDDAPVGFNSDPKPAFSAASGPVRPSGLVARSSPMSTPGGVYGSNENPPPSSVPALAPGGLSGYSGAGQGSAVPGGN